MFKTTSQFPRHPTFLHILTELKFQTLKTARRQRIELLLMSSSRRSHHKGWTLRSLACRSTQEVLEQYHIQMRQSQNR